MEMDPGIFAQLQRQVLEIVQSPNYRPQKPKGLARLLQLESNDRPVLRRLLKKMIADGQLLYGKSHLLYPGNVPQTDIDLPKKKQSWSDLAKQESEKNSANWIIGTFRTTRSGFGFVRPHTSDPDPSPFEQDIMIFRQGTLDAIDGDIVAVELIGRHSQRLNGDVEQEKRRNRRSERRDSKEGKTDSDLPRLRGRIVKIIERRTEQFVGTFYTRDHWAYVQVDGHLFEESVEVNDLKGLSPQNGEKVAIEMVRFPRPDYPGEAILLETLGPHGTPGLETQLIIREFNLPDHFTESALRAAREEGHVFFETLPEENANETEIDEFLTSQGRADFTKDVTITIDPPDARDFDDAVSLKRLENGHWLLHVHIADVSHFVKENSPIDLDAKSRGTSVYLPDYVIPMLPEILSNALASLQPGKIRFTKTVGMEFTPEGIPCNTEIYKSAIRSQARLTYDEVQDWFDSTDKQLLSLSNESKNNDIDGFDDNDTKELIDDETNSLTNRPEITALLDDMRELARILRVRRKKRGALELDRPDIKIDLDENGHVCGAHAQFQREANQVIEEFMLAANEAVAQFLADKELPFLHRVHPPPSYRKIKAFTDFLRAVTSDREEHRNSSSPTQTLLPDSTFSKDVVSSLLDKEYFPDELIRSRFTIQEILDHIKGTRVEPAIHLALLRSLQQAIYSPEEEGHYALASSCYCHFTSPIRRYPDLTIHRLLDSCLSGLKGHPDFQTLRLLGEHCSHLERRAESAERECVKLKMISYLQERPGLKMSGLISGVTRAGLFVEGLEIPAEGFIPLETIQDDHYWLDREEQMLRGRKTGRTFRLGDPVNIVVVRADPDKRDIQFKLENPRK